MAQTFLTRTYEGLAQKDTGVVVMLIEPDADVNDRHCRARTVSGLTARLAHGLREDEHHKWRGGIIR